MAAVAVSPDGRRLATAGAEDSTVFFFAPSSSSSGGFASGGGLEPVAFVTLPSPASCIEWSQDGKQLICGTAVGTVQEVLAPEPGAVDTTKTYEVHGHVGRKYTFRPPKPPRKKKVKALAAEEGGAEGGAAAGGEGATTSPPAGEGSKPEGADGDAPPPEDEYEDEPEEEIIPAEVGEGPSRHKVRMNRIILCGKRYLVSKSNLYCLIRPSGADCAYRPRWLWRPSADDGRHQLRNHLAGQL